ncbi:MAG: arylsulfatase [Thermomicrobiales bacterium]|nr:arylsulfatase [Thermomicrobiales bacterium]
MASKPNILILWGDDIGWWNISYNSHGQMGYQTPNIDRIAREGLAFTDYYGQQSCTAGRAAFITGQNPLRTGLTKVGMPGAEIGLQAEDPTIAELLKAQGYTCGQFGKNHLGDRDEHLPTMHGFDEFFGNLYHLNAEEEPEHPDYPKSPEFKARFGPRGVLHSRLNADGTQSIEDTGPLTKTRMLTIDNEINERAKGFIDSAVERDTPFFLWWNSTHMHYRTHTREEDLGRTGQGFYNDAMAYHDDLVGEMLDHLDHLGIADNTIVMYSTDNGPHFNAWPDAGITPFKSEKNTNWEGAFRVPAFFRWPEHFPAGKWLNGIVSHQDVLPTLLAAAGEPEIQEKLLNGYEADGKTFKVHIDGYNMLDYFSGATDECPRDEFFYINDDGELMALRYRDWKLIFLEQRAHKLEVWMEPFVELRIPKIVNLRRDPFERAPDDANSYYDWLLDIAFLVVPAQSLVARYMETLIDFPPRQKPASFNLDRVQERLLDAAGGGAH